MTETEALYRALIERIPAATYVDGPDGTPVYVSPQIEELYGCSRDEWMRNTGVWQQRVHPEDRARVRAAWEGALREGREFSDEYRILMPDGAQRWVQEHSTPLRDDTGHVRVVQGVITDVTDRHRAEVAERRAEQVLREMLDAIPLARRDRGHGRPHGLLQPASGRRARPDGRRSCSAGTGWTPSRSSRGATWSAGTTSCSAAAR